ncbi:MAG: Rab family GTPase [Candidatus Helarchaeota archaeon]
MSESIYTLKLVCIGDYGVGKSSLITRYVHDKFDSDYISTIGVDFLVKDVKLSNIEKATARLVIWDIGGQEQWKKKLKLYLQGADGAIIVCDLTRPVTARNLSMWIDYLKLYTSSTVPHIIVGNKNDLSEKKISQEKLDELSQDQPVFITSAKTGEVVEESFQKITDLIIEHKKTK